MSDKIIPTQNLVQELMKEYDVSLDELAKNSGMELSDVQNFIYGKSRLYFNMAIALGKYRYEEHDANWWMNYDIEYRKSLWT